MEPVAHGFDRTCEDARCLVCGGGRWVSVPVHVPVLDKRGVEVGQRLLCYARLPQRREPQGA